MTEYSELKSATVGFVRNSTDTIGIYLVTRLLEEIKERDKRYAELENAKTRVVYKEVDPHLEYNFGPGGA